MKFLTFKQIFSCKFVGQYTFTRIYISNLIQSISTNYFYKIHFYHAEPNKKSLSFLLLIYFSLLHISVIYLIKEIFLLTFLHEITPWKKWFFVLFLLITTTSTVQIRRNGQLITSLFCSSIGRQSTTNQQLQSQIKTNSGSTKPSYFFYIFFFDFFTHSCMAHILVIPVTVEG